MWENRNHILHNTLHPAAVRKREALYTVVQAQFLLGLDTLLPDDHFLLTRQTLNHVLLNLSLASMRQWLELIDLARLCFNSSLAPPASTLQQQWLRKWLLLAYVPLFYPVWGYTSLSPRHLCNDARCFVFSTTKILALAVTVRFAFLFSVLYAFPCVACSGDVLISLFYDRHV